MTKFGQLVIYGLCFPVIYINFDILTNFEVNQTKIGHSIYRKQLLIIEKLVACILISCIFETQYFELNLGSNIIISNYL